MATYPSQSWSDCSGYLIRKQWSLVPCVGRVRNKLSIEVLMFPAKVAYFRLDVSVWYVYIWHASLWGVAMHVGTYLLHLQVHSSNYLLLLSASCLPDRRFTVRPVLDLMQLARFGNSLLYSFSY